MRRISTVIVAVVAGVALLTACGGSTKSTTDDASSGPGFNDADVQFATDMIRHHAQALLMVDMTVGRDLSPQIARLAEGIRMAQSPEIEQMVTWLEKWGEPVPSTSRDHTGHDMGSMGMPGMASMADLATLERARGAKFEKLFLSLMIEHHQGAIEMAQSELAQGENAAAKRLAEEIISGQQHEITTMKQLLAGG